MLPSKAPGALKPHPPAKQIVEKDQVTPDLEQPSDLNYTGHSLLGPPAKLNPQNLTAANVIQLQRTIGNQAVRRLLAKTHQKPPQQSTTDLSKTKINTSLKNKEKAKDNPELSRVIQRIVGFEFETSWHLDRTDTKAKGLERNQVVAEKSGSWKLTAEEVPGKNFTVAEFKTQAVSEMDGEAQKAVFEAFMPSVKSLSSITKPALLKELGFPTTGGFEDVQITPNKELRAQPQVTGGIRLDRILDFMKETANTESGLRARTYVSETAKSAEKTFKDTPPEVAGVIALIAAYIQGAGQAQEKVEYPKGAISILSRMNVAELLQEVAPGIKPTQLKNMVEDISGSPVDGLVAKLEDIYRTHLKVENKDRDGFNLAIDGVFKGQEGLLGDKYNNLLSTSKADWTYKHMGDQKIKDMKKRFAKVEPPMFSSEARENKKIPSTSSSSWLENLARGVDTIDWAFGTSPDNQEGKKFGIEPVGEGNKHKGVPLEVRSLASVDWNEWMPLAMTLFDTIRRINSDEKPEQEKVKKLTRRGSNSELNLPKSLQKEKGEEKKLTRRNSIEDLSKVLVSFVGPRKEKPPEKNLEETK